MALDVMARGMDRLQEINMKIHRSHLSYLQTDDSPSKIEERLKLEGIINEYLCLVPNENKYVFQETALILHRSAATFNDFSAYRASEAWSAISMYASNLLSQPWRKEYRTLRTYSGYYKHEIDANLIGAEIMFELMGYRHHGLGILSLEGPIDPDKVSSVSRDAIVAFVECEILKQIWESVSKSFTVSWLEVLEFRENFVGTPEQAIRALNHRFLERIHLSRIKSENYRDFHHSQMCLMDTVPPTTAPYHINSNTFNTAIPMKSNFSHPIENDRIFSSYGFHNVTAIPVNHRNRYYTGMQSDIQQYQPRVSTERLIEFDTPNYDKNEKIQNHYGRTIHKDLDQVDFFSKRNYQYDEDYSKVERKPIKTSTSLDSAPTENWDYVYKALEDNGCSKDNGDRDDFLRKKDKHKEKHRTIINDYDDQYFSKNLVIDKRKSPEFNREKFTNGKELKKRHNNLSLDLTDFSSSNPSSEDKMKKSSQPKNYQKIADSVKNLSIGTKVEKKKTDEDKWDCQSCTYLNKPEKKICEMCGKSRARVVEEKPLESGSKQCPKCTLINEKNASNCEACQISLQNSATYV